MSLGKIAEPELNESIPGDSWDTSTPKALAISLGVFGISEYLSADKQEVFTNWLKGNTTGNSLIRAGVPEGWEIRVEPVAMELEMI